MHCKQHDMQSVRSAIVLQEMEILLLMLLYLSKRWKRVRPASCTNMHVQ